MFQYIQTDPAALIYVGMEDSSSKSYFGGVEGIIVREMDIKLKYTALVTRTRRPSDRAFPIKEVGGRFGSD